jgi:hypothetical protein
LVLPIRTEPRATSSGEPAFSFGPFRFVVTQRLLFESDKPVRLGSCAFDILDAVVVGLTAAPAAAIADRPV